MTSPSRPRTQLGLVELETREVLSGLQPTVAEQVFLERLNDARANPAAYGASIGVNLSGVPASPPLAFDPRLIQAATAHSQDMNARAYFGHTGSDGSSPQSRMSAAGYPWRGWAESLAAGYSSPETFLQSLIADTQLPTHDHRNQLLAVGSVNQSLKAVGVGLLFGGTGPYHSYATIDAGYTADTRPYLTGVVYTDKNHNGRYDAGEGVAGATVTVRGVGTVTTWATGGYSVQVNPGQYTVSVSGGGLPGTIYRIVQLGGDNQRLDFVNTMTTQPQTQSPPPPAPPPTVQPNHAPVLSAVSNRTTRVNTPVSVTLSATDADRNALTYTASVQSQAYALDQQYGFYSNGNQFTNYWGRGEKWFNGAGGWYFIQPDGEVFRVGTGSQATLVGRLETAYYQNPSKLFNATRGASVRVSGNVVTVAPETGFVGKLTVTVTVNDGHGGTATRTFQVTVS